jgi:Na+/proline symporter
MYFIISRTLGATLRLYLVINVLQLFILDKMGVPFPATTVIILVMILLYTFKGGVKTIVWTDTLQTFFMLLALVVCVGYIFSSLDDSLSNLITKMSDNGYTRFINADVNDKSFFLKQIIGGIFITISMTGLDQEMMQKNISVKTLADSQKNMLSFSVVLVLVNFLFLLLGALLYLYAAQNNIAAAKDELFPTLAVNYFPGIIGIIFIIGLVSALFPSADGAITALTSSFCIDMIGMNRNDKMDETQKQRTRKTVHLCFSVVFLLMVLFFKELNNKSVISILLNIAGYTYGPLLGLFAFGVFTRRMPHAQLTPAICVVAPVLCYLLQQHDKQWLNGYSFGFEMLLLNGLITFGGLWLVSEAPKEQMKRS